MVGEGGVCVGPGRDFLLGRINLLCAPHETHDKSVIFSLFSIFENTLFVYIFFQYTLNIF